MKKSIIREIFHGNRGQLETLMTKPDDNDTREKLSEAYDKLAEKLTPETMQLHRQFVDKLEQNNLSEVAAYFAEGFKLGLLIGIECLDD